jgi:hypothetical protein
MDAVNDAAAHPELTPAARRGQHAIAAATAHLRATVTGLAQLADAATTIDAAITTAHAEQTRHRHRDQTAQHLARLHATLTTAATIPDNQLADAAAAASAAAHYTTANINPTR